MTSLLHLHADRRGDVQLLTVSGRVDGNTATELAAALAQLGQSYTALVLDVSGLTFLSSAGLRELMVLAKQLTSRQGVAVLAGAPAHINEVLDMSGLSTVLRQAASVDEALAALAAPSSGSWWSRWRSSR